MAFAATMEPHSSISIFATSSIRRVTATAVVEDREGNVWIGSTGGVTRFDGESFTTFTEDDGLNSTFVWSLFVDTAGVIWIGTYDGVSRFDGNAFLPFPIPASTRNDTVFGPTSPTVVWDITQDPAGNLWFAAEAGVYKYDGQTLSRVRVMEDESDTFVTGILCDRKGNIWFATRYKGMIRLDGGRVHECDAAGRAPRNRGGVRLRG